jgi:cephalosporin hydroxylase
VPGYRSRLYQAIPFGLRRGLRRAFFAVAQRAVVNAFHELYYQSPARTLMNTYWFGVPVRKCPLDLWIYQELIAEQRPDVIIETGTAHGGSALFFASLCDLLGRGRVITVDVGLIEGRPEHERITYVHGSSVADETVEEVKALAAGARRIMVVLDSDHRREHVLRELKLYSPLVSPGSYLIVEDTNINGHPVARTYGPGPMEAVQEFLRGTSEFVPDREAEKFFLTFNPRGYLRRA